MKALHSWAERKSSIRKTESFTSCSVRIASPVFQTAAPAGSTAAGRPFLEIRPKADDSMTPPGDSRPRGEECQSAGAVSGALLFLPVLSLAVIFGRMSEVTRILSAIEQGDLHAAEQLLPLVYGELRRLAAEKLAQEKPGQTLE